MRISANGLTLIQKFEGLGGALPSTKGLQLFSFYVCPAGVYTVGWGHALTTPEGHIITVKTPDAAALAHAAMETLFGKQVVTRAEVDDLLAKDLEQYAAGLEDEIGANNATQAEFDALVAFYYNIGDHNFKASTVKRLHLAGQRQIGNVDMADLSTKAKAHAPPTTLALAFAEWCEIHGSYALGLFRRRIAEVLVYSGWDAEKAYQTVEAFS